ncbi:unnamed protein product [Acanthoscelides obtectus]|uniref:Uncharacterized protein n=1 Tax=Acanthoscelides obtectus TaxID=200917 RepID=A0A9P0VP85_ACAOB|nr:unnamed protein product [Acanthoscelides obtectus]CAK1688222.1 hypothetical protein AOBTE_LOCUS36621 [Acanthoscelides obtectus]
MSVSQGGLPPGKKRKESKDSMDAIIEDNSQGVISVDKDLSDEYLLERIKPFDSHCIFSVDSVKRMHRKSDQNGDIKYLPINKVVVTFQAQELPKRVAINHVLFDVNHYIQKSTKAQTSINIPNANSHFTQRLSKPLKRNSPSSPDLTEEARRQIVITLSVKTGQMAKEEWLY